MMNRRDLLTIGAMAPILGLTGCAVFGAVLRVAVRGRVVRAGARSARASPRGTVVTLGRSGATTLHLMRLAQRVQPITVARPVGHVVGAESAAVALTLLAHDDLCETRIDNVPISKSEQKGRFATHYANMFGREYEVGHSVTLSDTEIEHQDHRGRTLAIDVYENDRIRHFDKDRDLLGITPLIIDRTPGNQSARIADDSYLSKELEDVNERARKEYGKAFGDLRMIESNTRACIERPSDMDCDDLVASSNAALINLEKNFA